MTRVLLADASALERMPSLVDPSQLHSGLLSALTLAVETQSLRFPRDVVADLEVTARGEVIAGWATGQGSRLRAFKADIAYARPLMAIVKECGFDDGFELLDGNEPSLAAIGRLACQYEAEGVEFVIVTEDIGEGPLSPTTEQLCIAASWAYIDARTALVELGLKSILR